MSDNYKQQPDTSPQSVINGESYNLDTREQLEADVRGVIFQWGWASEWPRDAQKFYERVVIQWLDRQAAITRYNERGMHDFILDRLERENDKLTAERDKWKAKAEYQQEILDCDCREIRDFQNEIDSLTAERDNLQAAIDAMENGQFYAMYKAKCEECEQLKKVVRTQAESFKKLECELAGKDG